MLEEGVPNQGGWPLFVLIIIFVYYVRCVKHKEEPTGLQRLRSCEAGATPEEVGVYREPRSWGRRFVLRNSSNFRLLPLHPKESERRVHTT